MSIHSKIGGEFADGYQIKKAAVLGSGVMGSGIAAHLANIGIPTLLLDIVPRITKEEEAKGLTLENRCSNRFSNTACAKTIKTKTSSSDVKEKFSMIKAGNLEDDLES